MEEARKQLEICVQHSPHKAVNHRRLADVLFGLTEWKRYEYHINKALELDPYSKIAQSQKEKYMYHQEHYITQNYDRSTATSTGDDESKYGDNYEDEMKQSQCGSMENAYHTPGGPPLHRNIWQRQFDAFWFDDVGITNEAFNGYYDKFVEYGLDDIRNVFCDDMRYQLKNEIGINEFAHIDCIMHSVDNIRKIGQEFKLWLKEHSLDQQFGHVFDKYGVYTFEGLRNRANETFACNPIDRNVIDHAAELLEATQN